MKNWITAIAIGLLSFTAQANTCTEITVKVLPFTVEHDYSKSFNELNALGNGSEVGMVRALYTKRVDGCSAQVGWTQARLFIASELRRSQCAFDHVLEHENEHVRIYTEGMTGMADRIRQRVAAGQRLSEAVDAESNAIRAQHREHDSPDEYRKNHTACRGAIKRLALGY